MRQNGVLCTYTVWNPTDRQLTDFGCGQRGTGWGGADNTSDGGGPRCGGGWATEMGWGSDRAGENGQAGEAGTQRGQGWKTKRAEWGEKMY